MTDVSTLKAPADPSSASLALFAAPSAPAFPARSPTLDGTVDEEESSTIKCICGFSDDDGSTVLCEKCDTWQHIVCYYESASDVPDVHECRDCAPRPVDAKRATDKQRLRREMHSMGERKPRIKAPPKTKKRVTAKEPLGTVQPNGWPVNANNDLQYNPDRKSGSPRDQPPPNKRPKTSHRTSGSISQAPNFAPGSRKRGASIMVNGHSPVKSPVSPEGPIEEFSLEFMNLYRQPEPSNTDSNSYTSIGVANDTAMWLKDPDALAEVSGGKKPQEVFSRIETTIQDLESSRAVEIAKQTDENSSITAHGLHPQWHFITAESLVPENGYIGELKGLIGSREDYRLDPANRWDLLRHPEPFVFFPPHLPIYIDARREGNMLRYARRSCLPNMSMKILIEETSSEYHFCFLATRQIDPGEELTIGWDIGADIHKQLAKVITNGAKDGLRKIQPWVSNVLANFGGCACDNTAGYECLLERARRNTTAEPVHAKSKSKKSKKLQISPLSTGHATNSRAGSETLARDGAEDDRMDARSTSGSHKSSSRDITPATHFSVDGDLKMSDREKRKLQQQERLFEQLEFDEQHKGKKAKRHSAGSTLNTPSLASSKRLGHPEPSPSARHREHSHGVARKISGSSTKTNGRLVPKPKPVYKDSSTQTEDEGNDARSPSSLPCRAMKPPMSFKRRLVQLAQQDKMSRDRSGSLTVKVEMQSPVPGEVASSKPSPRPPSPPEEPATADAGSVPPPNTKVMDLTPPKEPTPPPTVDVEMGDAEDATVVEPIPKEEEAVDAPAPPSSSEPPKDPIHPPAPPWPPTVSDTETSTFPALHVELPTKTELISPAATTVSTPGLTPTAVSGSTQAISPTLTAATASPFSPAVKDAVAPMPRKKLSLSAYTSRLAKRTQTASSGPGATSATTPTLGQTQTSSPTLSTASLPASESAGKTGDSVMTGTGDDIKSEPAVQDIVVPAPSATTAP